MSSLVTYHLLFTTEVVSPLELDDHSGAALRGNLFESIWKRFCTNKTAPSCADCPLHTVCPVSALVAPLRDESPQGRDVPRPYIILPPLRSSHRYEPGEKLAFGLTLFGTIIQFLPYIILALNMLEEAGLGKKVADNGGQRGRFRIEKVEAYHPITGEQQEIYCQGKTLLQTPMISVSPEDVAIKAKKLSTSQITLRFLTPTRLIDQDRLVHRAAFRPLVVRLQQRLSVLQATYGEKGGGEQYWSEDKELVELANAVTCYRDNTHWREVKSFSRRQKRFTPVSGFVGEATFTGELAPFRELLIWGELIHVGKSVVKGNGWYKIEE